MSRIFFIPISIALASQALFANPQLPNVSAGTVDFTDQANLLEIRPSDGAIINWKDFSIQPNEVTRFIQPHCSARVLNRVTGGGGSSLLGTLDANGQIYLINPHGVIIGKDAKIHTNGLFITTFEMDDDLFTKDEWFLKGGSDAAIINHGSVEAGDGDVYFIAQKVQNIGQITTNGSIELAAGCEILVKPQGDEKISIKPDFVDCCVENDGVLRAVEIELRAAVNPYSLAIRHRGKAQTISLVERDGNILLCTEGQIAVDGSLIAENIVVLGDSVLVESNAYLEGTDLTIGGDHARYVRVDEGAVLTAGDRIGRMILWGDEVCAFNGSISMNGGFVEISSNGLLMPMGTVNTNGGTLLLDPSTVTINAISDTSLGPFAFVPPTLPPPPAPGRIYSFTAAAATILNTNLQGFLATNNVMIDTANAFGGVGDIIVDAPLLWGSQFTLFLKADRDIQFNQTAQCTGSGGFNLSATRDIIVNTALSAIPVEVITASGAITGSAGNDILLTGGIAAGARASMISGSGAINLGATNNITLQGGTAANAFAEVTSTSGAISGSAGNNLQVFGGSAANAHAAILNNSLTITLSSGFDTILSGSTNTDCYAEISSITGNVTFTNIGNDLILNGGTGLNAYAQIGKGNTSIPVAVNSNITFNAIGQNVSLLPVGGSGGGYAQIGHSPFVGISPVSAAGNITFPSAGVGNNITLQGGTVANNTAIIGHGNLLSSLLGTCSGAISVVAQGDIVINAGIVSGTHAVIGFQNPTLGSAVPFIATSSKVLVQTNPVGTGTIVLGSNTVTGSNSVIGYYNDTNTGIQPTTVDITLIDVQTPSFLNLIAGRLSGGTGGVAAIGTYVQVGNADSSITTSSNLLQVLGPQVGGNDGSARIINQRPPCIAPCTTACTPTSRSVTLRTLSAPGDVNVLGGIGLTTGFADIYSSGTLAIDFIGNLNVNNLLQNGYAHIVACGDIFMNATNTANDLLLTGGTNAVADAIIQSISRTVNWGAGFVNGGLNLTVGNAMSRARSQILTSTGNSTFLFALDANILGGTTGGGVPEPYAEIGSDLGSIYLQSANGSLIMTAGSVTNSWVQIASTNGDIHLTFANGSATLNGSTTVLASNAYAQIGRGIISSIAPITNVISNIFIHNINGPLTLNSGAGPNCYTQIGHSPVNGAVTTSVTGNICVVDLFINGAINLNGGSNTNTTAIIGHGNELTPFLGTATGNIDLTTLTGGVTLAPGIPQSSHAIIGFHNPLGGSSVPFTCNGSGTLCNFSSLPGIRVNSRGGNILLTGGIGTLLNPGSNAIIGYYNNTNGGSAANVIVPNIVVSADFANNITLQAHKGGITGGIAAIGTFANAGSSAFSNINVTGHNVSLLGPPVPPEDSAARIINSRPGVSNFLFNVTITANLNLTLLGGTGAITGFADVYSCNDATIKFFGDCTINNIMQNGYAQIVANHSVMMNIAPVGNFLSLAGGTNFGAHALIQATTGQCLVGGFSPGPNSIQIGNPLSLAPSSIVANLDVNAVAASTSIALFGGAGANVSALIKNTSGFINVNAGTTLSLTGGSASFATAEIQNAISGINFLTGSHVTLTGGSGTDSFAQIGTFIGDITSFSIGGNLTLKGGSNTNAFAQIGMGEDHLDPLHLIIQSNINLSSITGNVLVEGGTFANTYAQIGHSPFGLALPYSATGNVNVNAAGNVTLNGSGFTNTSATIGHGNPLTTHLGSVVGGVTVSAAGITGVQLNPGVGTDAHTTIGFFSPFAGSLAGFTVNSSTVNVSTTIGPISVVAANGNNATIGYYNAATPTAVSVSILNMNISTGILAPAPPNQVILQADNGGPTHGIASIGTFSASGTTSVANLAITTYELDVNGPIAGNNGQALIYNNQPCNPPCSPCVFGANNMVLKTTNINIKGGLGLAPGFAAIYSAQDMEIDFMGVFNINLDPLSPATLQTLNATVVAGRNISVNPKDQAGDMFVLGGTAATVRSEMVSINGNIVWGDRTQDLPGIKNLTIGRSDMMGPARIFTCPATGGTIDLLGGTITIQGGLVMDALADFNANGALKVLTTGNINLFAGPAVNTGALMNATMGPLFVVCQGSVSLTGSPLSQAAFTNQAGLFHVEATYNINITANSTFRNNGNGPTFVYAGNDITLNDMGSMINFGSGPLTALAGHSLFIQNNSLIQTNGGALALVVDDNFPTPPGIGTGFINQDVSSIINSGGGSLRIFTARRNLNVLAGNINGFTFVPGTEFINTAREIWGIYYPSNLGGFPFTIFYKDFIPNPSSNVIPLVRAANNEFCQVVDAFDDFSFDVVFAYLAYDRAAFDAVCRPMSALMSYEVVPDIDYSNIRRTYPNYYLKKIDTLR